MAVIIIIVIVAYLVAKIFHHVDHSRNILSFVGMTGAPVGLVSKAFQEITWS